MKDTLEVGYDVPAAIGMAEEEVQTPCLIVDLDAFERNVERMGRLAREMGVAHRSHGKMHKSVDVQRVQERLGGAIGVCCQKVSEAEAFARGGIGDILISNEVRGAAKIDRLARLPAVGAAISVCVDDIEAVPPLSDAATRHGTTLAVLVEVDCGAERCGVQNPEAAVAIARAVSFAPGLTFAGVQAYNGAIQHIRDHDERAQAARETIAATRRAVNALAAADLPCRTVTGAGTGSFRFEGTSDLYTEIQCGSYAFMDADYGRIEGPDGRRLDADEWENALFVLTEVMSMPTPTRAVCDAGHKTHAIDSGPPTVFGRADLEVLDCSDEHLVLEDADATLSVGDRLRLVPGHCDPTCNLHDWYVGVRDGRVETLWPVTARGKVF